MDQASSLKNEASDISIQKLIQNNIKVLIWILISISIIRTIFLEAFKISSTSMEPTLIGDPRCGDLVLVNKVIYHYQPPQRWDVVVFHYPLNQNRPFVKRLVGLPGETIVIQNGNIYIDGKILRKPENIQNILKYSLFHPQQDWKEYWSSPEKGCLWEESGFQLSTEDLAFFTYSKPIVDKFQPYQDEYFCNRKNSLRIVGGNYRVGEIEIAFTVIPQRKGTVVSQIRTGSFRWVLELSCEPGQKSYFRQYRGESTTPTLEISQEYFLSPQSPHNIRFQNWDLFIEVFVDQQKLWEYDYSQPLEETPNITYEVSAKIGGKNGKFSFSKVYLYRDVYIPIQRYLWGNESWKIPTDSYFVLGDNATDSYDSREWSKFQVLLQNNTYLEGDAKFPPKLNYNRYSFIDKYGIPQNILREQIQEQNAISVPEPFVSKHQLIGKAWLVAWPPPRIKKIQ